MQILEHGQAQERTLLFFPCTAEPVWLLPTRSRCFLRDGMFFRWCMTAISGVSRGFHLSRADRGRGDLLLRKPRHLPSGRGLWLLHGRGLPDPYAGIGGNAHRPGHHRRRDHALSAALPGAKAAALAGYCILQNGGKQPKNTGSSFSAGTVHSRSTTPKRSTTPWKPISKPFRSDDPQCILVCQQLCASEALR